MTDEERKRIHEALDGADGNRAAAAAVLDMPMVKLNAAISNDPALRQVYSKSKRKGNHQGEELVPSEEEAEAEFQATMLQLGTLANVELDQQRMSGLLMSFGIKQKRQILANMTGGAAFLAMQTLQYCLDKKKEIEAGYKGPPGGDGFDPSIQWQKDRNDELLKGLDTYRKYFEGMSNSVAADAKAKAAGKRIKQGKPGFTPKGTQVLAQAGSTVNLNGGKKE